VHKPPKQPLPKVEMSPFDIYFWPELLLNPLDKYPRGLGTESPTEQKNRKAKKSHPRKVALKVGYCFVAETSFFLIVHGKNMSDIAKIKR
jgi:hypothetical protein